MKGELIRIQYVQHLQDYVCQVFQWSLLLMAPRNTFKQKIIKGYFQYNTITSQNVSFEAHVKKIYFEEKLCSILKIFQFLYF